MIICIKMKGVDIGNITVVKNVMIGKWNTGMQGKHEKNIILY